MNISSDSETAQILEGCIGSLEGARTYMLTLRQLVNGIGSPWGNSPNQAAMIERARLTKLSIALKGLGIIALERKVREYRSLRDQNGCVHISTGVITVWLHDLSQAALPMLSSNQVKERVTRPKLRNLGTTHNKAGVPFV